MADNATLMQLRRRVRSRLGIPATDQFFTDDVIDDHINLALEAVDSEHNWPWNETARTVPIDTSDGKLAALADDPERRTIRSVFVAGIELDGVSSSDFLRDYSVGYRGQPRVWCEIGDDILVRPIPEVPTDANVVCYVVTAPLVQDADVLVMPTQYAGSVIAKAAELLSVREDNGTAAERHASEYAQWLGRMRRSLRRHTGPATPRVREGGWI